MGDRDDIADLSGGANQARVRAHNERVVLSLVRRHGTLSKAEIARRSGLSPQTVTVIMRALEQDDLLLRGDPVRGKVGQPSIPMSLNPSGAFSVGVKIGRRSLDLVLMDFTGAVRQDLRHTYPYPRPAEVLSRISEGTAQMLATLTPGQRARVAGLGVAMPFELWNWAETLRLPATAMDAWREVDVVAEVAASTGLPVLLQNDGTAACGAEFLFGRGRETDNYGYFFLGAFIGGGLVLDGRLITGPTGSAGATGTLRVTGPGGQSTALLDCASMWVLEEAVAASGGSVPDLRNTPEDWSALGQVLEDWITETAAYLAQAALNVCSVIDFEVMILDGHMPADVRRRLVAATRAAIDRQDTRGIRPFALWPGSLGYDAQVLGGASLPILARYLIDTTVLFPEARGVHANQVTS
ncbi:MAG: ROK family transcriptional regulator [Pseudomonadota bacterium]